MTEEGFKPFGRGLADAIHSAALSYDVGRPKTMQDLSEAEQEALRLEWRLAANYSSAELLLRQRLRQAGITHPVEHERLLQAMKEHHDRVVGVLESPIERIMLPWLVALPEKRLRRHVVRTALASEDDRPRTRDIRIVPQLAIGRHRLDFGIVVQIADRTMILALECDGREFHHVSDDATRDRYLASLGIYTLRATGAEINAAPDHVAMRVADAIEIWIDGKLAKAGTTP